MKHSALFVALVLVVSCLGMSPQARADSFLLTTSGSGITVSALLTGVVDPYNPNAIDVQSGSGELNGNIPLTLVTPSGTTQTQQTLTFHNVPPPIDGSYTYDNVLYLSGNNGLALDPDGLLFSEPDDYLNIFAQGAYSFSDDEIINGFSSPLMSFSLSPAPTPEPSSFALLGSGLLAVAGYARRRARA